MVGKDSVKSKKTEELKMIRTKRKKKNEVKFSNQVNYKYFKSNRDEEIKFQKQQKFSHRNTMYGIGFYDYHLFGV